MADEISGVRSPVPPTPHRADEHGVSLDRQDASARVDSTYLLPCRRLVAQVEPGVLEAIAAPNRHEHVPAGRESGQNDVASCREIQPKDACTCHATCSAATVSRSMTASAIAVSSGV